MDSNQLDPETLKTAPGRHQSHTGTFHCQDTTGTDGGKKKRELGDRESNPDIRRDRTEY
jgi:hypothetical protein